jgi:precorrin-3B synthase
MTAFSLDRFALEMRRGACPALSAPMITGDGLLARIALTGTVSPDQLAQVCQLALTHGNGMIDISARGNLQIRGLSQSSAAVLDRQVRAMNLPLREGLAVEVPPFAGLDPTENADPRPLAHAICEGARGITGLAPKMTVVVDGHGQLRHSALLADIRLMAVKGDRWKILLGGTEASGSIFNVLRETQAVDAVLDLLRQLSALGPKARGRDLVASGNGKAVARLYPGRDSDTTPLSAGLSRGSASIGTAPTRQMLETSPSMTAEQATTSPFSLFVLSGDLHAVGVGPAFGQAQAADLLALCQKAVHLGLRSLRPALDHSLLFLGSPPACLALQRWAGDHGFIITVDDPRGQIAACSGAPACRSAAIATHEIGLQAAAQCHDLLDGSFKLHVSGCRKGCAHPQASALSLCGTNVGISVIAQGKAADEPFASGNFADTPAMLRRLADLVRSEKRPSENSAQCLARIGSARLAAAATGRP